MRTVLFVLALFLEMEGSAIPSVPLHPLKSMHACDTLSNSRRNSSNDPIRFPVPVPYRKNLLWGFCVSRSEFITPVIYDSVCEFWDGRAAVCLHGSWGTIDSAGNEIVPPKFRGISDAMDGIIIGRDIHGNEIFNYQGKLLSTLKGQFDYTGMEYLYNGILPVKKNGRWGFFNIRTGRFVLPVKYIVNGFFKNIATITGYKYGAIDFTTGDTVIKLIYDQPLRFFYGLAKVERKGKAGFVNKYGKLIVPLIYDKIKEAGEDPPDGTLDFTGGFARVELNHKYGYLTMKGTKLTELKYDYAEPFNFGFGVVVVNGLYNALDTNGVELFQFSRYEDLTVSMTIYRDKKNYFVYQDYQQVDTTRFDKAKYEAVWPWKYGCYSVKKNGKAGFVDYTGYEYFED